MVVYDLNLNILVLFVPDSCPKDFHLQKAPGLQILRVSRDREFGRIFVVCVYFFLFGADRKK